MQIARALHGGIALAFLLLLLGLPTPGAHAFSQRCCGPWQQGGQMAISPDGNQLYVADYQVTLALKRNADTGALELIDSYDGGGGVVELSADGRHLYVTDSRSPYGSKINAFAREPTTGALSRIGHWESSAPGSLADLELLDERTMYVTDRARDALMILDRDPASGRLDFRRELRNGRDGEGLSGPTGLAIAPRGDWLYTYQAKTPSRISAFALGAGGEPTSRPDAVCECLASVDLEMSSDGRRLLGGPFGPSVFDRDPDTGFVTDTPSPRTVGSGGDELADGSLAIAAGDRSAYSTDWWGKRLIQYEDGPGGLAVRRYYHQGRDGQGLDNPRAIALSPDGRHLYLSGGQVPTSQAAGTVAVFRRDEASGDLSFASLFTGPNFDGRPPHLQGQVPKIEINGGDEFTNDPDVLISVVDGGRSDFQIQMSNDGGFKKSEMRRIDETNAYPWTLASSGPERLPKTVYARLLGMSSYGGQTFSDSIVLDERAPVVVFARVVGGGSGATRKAAARKLSLRARDNLSGVSRVQVTRNRRRPGKWLKFARSVPVPSGRGALHVRVRDRAGNASRWKTVGG
jgi:6-phosphogluconolactonase (cycloisomerase 2 family)